MTENLVPIRKMTANAIEAVNHLRDAVITNPRAFSDLEAVIRLITEFGADLEACDNAVMNIDTAMHADAARTALKAK